MKTDSESDLNVSTEKERVKIPKALIERLKGLGPHFCLVKARDKDPSIGGKGWQKAENLMFADDPRLREHLKCGGNYGVVGGFGLVIVDTDIEELKQIVKEKLPPTFTSESPGSHGWHSSFLCGLEKPIRLRDKDGENVGDIQGPGKMVVGPGSIHPNGGVYRIIDDRALAQVTREQLIEAFKDYVVPDKEIEAVEATARSEKRKAKIDLDILQVVPLSGLKKRGDEYYGPHPVHGSQTRQNFWVNPSKNCWHCFRHSSGGGPLLWLAVEEGIVDCSEAGFGSLKGAVFKQVLLKAKERGLIKEFKPKISRIELPISEKVSDIFAYNGDRKFNSRIQIKSLGFPKSRFLNLEFYCNHGRGELCGVCGFDGYKLNFADSFDASAFATYFDTNNPAKAFIVLKQKGMVEGCKYVLAKGTKEIAITQAEISDRIGNESKAWFVHSDKCDLRKGPNWIFANGHLCRANYGRIGVLVVEFQNESEVMMPDEKTVETSRDYLRTITTEDEPTVSKVARVLRKKSNLKGKETTRGYEADLLTIGSPVWVKTPEGPKILAMTSLELGETTTAKSQREREIINWLKAGQYETGRKTSAGLAAGAEKIEGMGWVMRKGLLPSADLSFLILDNMVPHALDEFIESRRNGVIMLSTIKSCELWARTRLKLLSNPLIPFESHMQKCIALKVYDRKLIARLVFAILTYGVDPETRYSPKITTVTEEDEAVLNAAWNVLRWNLSQETTYTVPLELWPEIMTLSKDLELKFGNEDIPLFLRANPHKIATLIYVFALFEGTEPAKKHVKQAYDWLVQCGVDLELDEFTAQWKEEHTLSEEDYEALKDTIDKQIIEDMKAGGNEKETTLFQFLDYIAKHGIAQMEEIAAAIRVSDRTVKRRAKEMKGLGLLKTSRTGYFFTARGVRFWKRWLKEMYGVPEAPVDPENEGQTVLTGGGKKGVTPKIEVIEDYEDTSIDKEIPKGPIPLQKPVTVDNKYYGRCPKCDTLFNYDDHDVGRLVRCRNCKLPMRPKWKSEAKG